jgi:hypothetical protein
MRDTEFERQRKCRFYIWITGERAELLKGVFSELSLTLPIIYLKAPIVGSWILVSGVQGKRSD